MKADVIHLRPRRSGAAISIASPRAIANAADRAAHVNRINPDDIAAALIVVVHTDGRLAISADGIDWAMINDIHQALMNAYWQRSNNNDINTVLDDWHQQRIAQQLEQTNWAQRHAAEYPHGCDHCGKRYKLAGWLDRHQSIRKQTHRRGWDRGRCSEDWTILASEVPRASCPEVPTPCPHCGVDQWKWLGWSLAEPNPRLVL